MNEVYDAIIIGGGQSGLASAYYLRRKNIKYCLLDAESSCGGSWQEYWDSLTLFSPAEHSSLPGWRMPESEGVFPTKDEVIDYLCQYEKRYDFPIHRSVRVESVEKAEDIFVLNTSRGKWRTRSLISATGTYQKPLIPDLPGRDMYRGEQIHSADYKSPDIGKGKKVLIVGGGNSGAQILAEVSEVTEVKWATLSPPEFLPDDVDGRVLFDQATAKYYAEKKGQPFDASRYNLGNIVMVPSVRDARDRKVLQSQPTFQSLYEDGVIWPDGNREAFDLIIWCTGFGYATQHLDPILSLDEKGKAKTEGTRSKNVRGLWLVGYGGWTGFASATIIGVGRSARATAKEVAAYLNERNP